MQKSFSSASVLTLPALRSHTPTITSRTVGAPARDAVRHVRPLSAPKKRVTASSRSRTRFSLRSINMRWVAYTLLAGNIALILASVVGVNYYAAEGYVIREIQGSVAKLEEQNKKLIVRTSEVASIAGLQDDLAAAGYVAAGSSDSVQVARFSQR